LAGAHWPIDHCAMVKTGRIGWKSGIFSADTEFVKAGDQESAQIQKLELNGLSSIVPL
jgi:hypothetical protein